jgi:uncharacterized MAPEG superfamily protein
MTTALSYLAWTLVLAVVQVTVASGAKRRQDGMQWAASNRDGASPEYTGLAARMIRAQANLYEALPLFIGAVLLAHASGRDGTLTAWGAGLFFWARLAYVPAYAYGVAPLRTLCWTVAVVGLALVLISLA